MSALRTAVVVLSLACIGLGYLVFAGAPQSEIDQSRIDAAVQEHDDQMRAAREEASDQLVANRQTDLLRDPATPVIGNADGDVAIVEFFDYTCSFCKAVEPRVEALLQDDPGVKLVLKEYPILTPESLIASKAALASINQGKYHEFHDALIGLSGRLTEERIFDVAADVELDVERLREEMNAPEITEQIIENFNLARALRIFQTPTFIVDNHILTGPSAEIDFPGVVAAARVD